MRRATPKFPDPISLTSSYFSIFPCLIYQKPQYQREKYKKKPFFSGLKYEYTKTEDWVQIRIKFEASIPQFEPKTTKLEIPVPERWKKK